jgi:dimethylglycine dehydrogenase
MYRDMDVEHTALESGLDRFIKFDKGDFVGRDALLKQQQAGLTQRLVAMRVETVDADAYMNEGVYAGGQLVGRITSGATSHHIGGCLSMAYVEQAYATSGTQLEVQVLENRCPAEIIADSPYDPENKRPRM